MNKKNNKKDIIYLKGNPLFILPSLTIFRKYNSEDNNKSKINIELINILSKLLPSKSPHYDNLIWARLIPPMERLGLIISERDKYTLTPLGAVVIKHIKSDEFDFELSYDRKDDLFIEFRNKLGKAMLDFDTTEAKIVEALIECQKSPGEFVSLVDLMIKLNGLGINPFQKLVEQDLTKQQISELKENNVEYSEGSRLVELLRYYDFFGIVIYRKYEVALNIPGISALRNIKLLRALGEISDEEFFSVLYKVYQNLSTKEKLSSIPIIPFIQRPVAYELEISYETFGEKLLSFPSHYKDKNIMLSPARDQKAVLEDSLKRGRMLYYYLSIIQKGN